MWDDVNWEVFNKLGEVTANISHSDVKGLLNFDKPLPFGNLLSWE